ncbi:hypothetical protein llap_12099 [Limosa lapponica baueri]|uniref:Uncharacterized protein n=1 Tax=Limosa lapponica baueri TaxID=1758121 RepID=A0A2I0TUX2_LIMLA|nr:hypothetical protein llap_12099 [Limosa lapponica baueri]
MLSEAGQDVLAARPVSPRGPANPDSSSPPIRDAPDALGAVTASISVDAGITRSLAGKQGTGIASKAGEHHDQPQILT